MTEQSRRGRADRATRSTSWPGVEAQTGDRGEFSLRVDGREIGHLHGDRSAHFVFPKALWAELYAQERIDYHPVFPGKPGFGSATDRHSRRTSAT